MNVFDPEPFKVKNFNHFPQIYIENLENLLVTKRYFDSLDFSLDDDLLKCSRRKSRKIKKKIRNIRQQAERILSEESKEKDEFDSILKDLGYNKDQDL